MKNQYPKLDSTFLRSAGIFGAPRLNESIQNKLITTFVDECVKAAEKYGCDIPEPVSINKVVNFEKGNRSILSMSWTCACSSWGSKQSM